MQYIEKPFITLSIIILFPIMACQSTVSKTAEEYLEIAQTYLDQKDYTSAIENLTKSIELDPSNPEAWNSRAYAYYFLQDYEKAIADYTETLHLEPEKGVAWVFRAQAYTQIGEYEKAAADMETIKRMIEAHKAETQTIKHD